MKKIKARLDMLEKRIPPKEEPMVIIRQIVTPGQLNKGYKNFWYMDSTGEQVPKPANQSMDDFIAALRESLPEGKVVKLICD